jgi:hypothetical protein
VRHQHEEEEMKPLTKCLVVAAIVFVFSLTPQMLADSGADHQVRNMHFGVSGGNVNDITRRFCCSGTLGALVTDGSTQYILSANHILARADQAAAGEDISQPGLIDNNCDVATVVADFTVAPALSSGVDCAIAELRAGTMDSTGFIEDIGTISSVVKEPSVGLQVVKSGRTTGLTGGTISSTSTTVRVGYPRHCGANGGRPFIFRNQVVISSSTFSSGGDSGSLIVSDDSCHQPVALLFAGSPTDTIGNPIGNVLSQLSSSLGSTVSLVGGVCSASAQSLTVVNAPSKASVELATRAMRSREKELMSRRGVIGVGVGASDGSPTEAAVVIYVDQNQRLASLPRRISGVRVKVMATEPFVAY